MADLFDAATPAGKQPLAAALRPATLDDVVGQEAITREGSILRRRIAARQLGSIILFGPPGVGKTTIARLVGKMMNKEFRPLHAARAGVADLRKLKDEARMKQILIFVDEVHRFSKTQVDDLLEICEEGTADFMGATTENPYHALPAALISRSTIMKLEPVPIEETEKLIRRAITHLARERVRISASPEIIRQIAGRAGGDARRALTILESLAIGRGMEETEITPEMVDEAYMAAPVNHDRGGDQKYDITSAFVKSMRGSDPDATLYWLARLIHGGEDPRYIARRIMVHAAEDVGLADNSALQTAVAALHAVEKIGYPEARIVLAQAALHIARAPKSNSAYRGINLAMAHVTSEPPLAVPLHLRDTHYEGAAALGHVGYRSPHSDERGWVEQDYAPGVRSGQFYQSDAREAGTFEKRSDLFWEGIMGRRQARPNSE